MCFVLYAGTVNPIPRRDWRDDAPDLTVQALTERDSPIAAHFTMPHVQYMGSTSGCGCDFPNVMYQNGEWPWFLNEEPDEDDLKKTLTEQMNRERLVALLRETGEPEIELYGVWDGDFATTPAKREEISVNEILDPGFRFKEKGFYRVRTTNASS